MYALLLSISVSLSLPLSLCRTLSLCLFLLPSRPTHSVVVRGHTSSGESSFYVQGLLHPFTDSKGERLSAHKSVDVI